MNTIWMLVNHIPGLMITASHQTFSSQLWYLTDQTKFDQTNLLCIINGEVNKFTIGKQMSGQFSTLIISTDILRELVIIQIGQFGITRGYNCTT